MNPTMGYRHLASTSDNFVRFAVSSALLKFINRWGGGNCLYICALCVLIAIYSTNLVGFNTSFNKHTLSCHLLVGASDEVLPKGRSVNTPDIWSLGKNNFLIRSVCRIRPLANVVTRENCSFSQG